MMIEDRMKWIAFYVICLAVVPVISQNQVVVEGTIVDADTNTPLSGVKVMAVSQELHTLSKANGGFVLNLFGDHTIYLEFHLLTYDLFRVKLDPTKEDQLIDLGEIKMRKDRSAFMIREAPAFQSLAADQYGDFNFAGSLRAGKDLFSRTLAYEFSGAFYKARGLDQRHNVVLLNGVTMNRLYTGRPDWNSWGGLNDALRNQETFSFLNSTPTDPGSLGTAMTMSTMAGVQRKGLKLSYANSDALYQHRLMLTYSGNWKDFAFLLSGSIRKGISGFKEGTPFKGYSLMLSVDHSFGKHLFNSSLILSSTNRSQSGPVTQEVLEAKGERYNSYWGWLNGKKKNQRQKRIFEPILQLNHYWEPMEKIRIESHLTVQFGQVAASRIDYGGGRLTKYGLAEGGGSNPDPTYYKKLPSYFLRDSNNPDFRGAFLAEQELKEHGQIDWNAMYLANSYVLREGRSIYALYEDCYQDLTLNFLGAMHWQTSAKNSLEAFFSFTNMQSRRYAMLTDLLGGERFLDVNLFAGEQEGRQNDLQHPNRWVLEGERYKYDYVIRANELKLGVRWNRNWTRGLIQLMAGVTQRDLYRTGMFENGNYPGNLSLGNSKTKGTVSPFVKGYFRYQLDGHHSLSTQLVYMDQPPPGRMYFNNERYSNALVRDLRTEKHLGGDLIYTLRHFRLNLRLALYYLKSIDLTNVAYYYSDGLTGLPEGDTQAYVQEIMTGISKLRMGIECSLAIPLLDNWKFRTTWVIGMNQYEGTPNLHLTSDQFEEEIDYGPTYLHGVHLSTGPTKAISVGIDYSSPKYWWIGITCNHFSKSYVSVAPVKRTRNFFLSNDGKPLTDLDESLAKEMWKQEELPSFSHVNIVGGKSWKIGNAYLGLFLAIRNLLNARSITGGFEQSRLANYQSLKEEYERKYPLFGNKYWLGNLRTYFLSVNVRI